MKFSEQWLREWVNPEISSQELMDQITMAGLEVDGFEKAAGDFSGVVVGEILTAERHPNADKLQVCTVTDGAEEFQVVCGAPNARAGLKVAFAKVGAVLPGEFKIKKAKLRSVESFGMLCSEQELELSESHDGIMELASGAPVGDDIRGYLGLDDVTIEVDLTTNRADCLSLAGMAREVGVLNRLPVTFPAFNKVEPQHDDTFPVAIAAEDGCPRYLGRVVKNVDVSVNTPIWMVERLRRSGIRSIDPVVDITNYVMIELGQPMHGFDLDQLKGGINVRWADNEEKLTLLDGSEVELTDQTLLITDESGPLALAGIMGGENTGVSATTKNIFFEAAYFNPLSIAGRARSYGLHTDSSHRFERGVDYTLAERAIERATELLLEIAGGQPGPVTDVKSAEHFPGEKSVSLKLSRIEKVLGLDIGEEDVDQILAGLGLELVSKDGETRSYKVPSYRFDIAIEVDLIEELARIYGYNRLPVTAPVAHLSLKAQPEVDVSVRDMRKVLVARGYQEAVTYSFVDADSQKLFNPELEGIALANPISTDLAVMRTSLWPGLVKALQHNLNRQQERVRLFETGLSFINTGNETQQDEMIAGLVYGARLPKGWTDQGDVDFYDLKADVEALLALSLGQEIEFTSGQHSALHPGQTACVELNGETVGYLGTLHPNLQKQLGLKKPAFLFELKQAAFNTSQLPAYQELSKFPGTTRDIAVIVDETLPVQALLNTVSEAAGEFLQDKVIFDVYQGKGIYPQRKSVALGLTWQHPSRTLNDDEINQWMDQVIQSLSDQYKATLRG